MNQEVTDYIQKTQLWQISVCESLRTMVHKAVPEIEERLQYGKPHFLKNGEFAAVIHVAKDKVSFMLFNAAEIDEVKGLVRSMGKGERKVVDIIEDQAVDYDLLASLLEKATHSL